MASQLLLVDFSLKGKTRVIAHLDRIVRNVPIEFGRTSEELLKKAEESAKMRLDETDTNFKGDNDGIRGSFVIDHAKTKSGRAYSLRNTKPYALGIETGNPKLSGWLPARDELHNWVINKLYDKDEELALYFLQIGKVRVGRKGFPYGYPDGIQFMQHGFQSILGDLTPKLREALLISMR